MTLRAIVIGISLALFVASYTYLNDAELGQTKFIGNYLPVSIFGFVILLQLIVNPLLSRLRHAWRLKPEELLVMAAIALAVCGWPGSSLMRTFAPNLVMPAHWQKSQTAWKATGVMSYVPGGSPAIADGQVRDWDKALKALESGSKAPVSSPANRLWTLLPEDTRSLVTRGSRTGLDRGERQLALQSFNRLITLRAEKTAFPATFAQTFRGVSFTQSFDQHPSNYLEYGERLVARWREAPQLAPLVDRITAGDGAEGADMPAIVRQRRTMRKALTLLTADAGPLVAAQRKRDAVIEKLTPLANRRADLNERLFELRRAAQEGDGPGLTTAQRQDIEAELVDIRNKLAPLQTRKAELTEKVDRLEDERVRLEWEGKILDSRLYRAVFEISMDGQLRPTPPGRGLLPGNGRTHPFGTNVFIQGSESDDVIGPTTLWRKLSYFWGPALKFWIPAALLMGLASLCIVLIVHPQWSERELLPYPIARFMHELCDQAPDGSGPLILRQRVFWISFIALFAIHGVNGLYSFDISFVRIPLELDFNALSELFPNAAKARMSWTVFKGFLYPTAIAFAYFISTEASFSIGISMILWLALGGFLISQGVSVGSDFIGMESRNALLFGAYTGSILFILYVGRRYYSQVVKGAAGIAVPAEIPRYSIWAARGLAVAVALWVILLRSMGVDWFLGLFLIALLLMMLVVITRINVETGAFWLQSWWLPVSVLTALFGVRAIGPEAYLVLALVSTVLIADPRSVVMPFLANGLRIARVREPKQVRRLTPLLVLMLVAGLLVATVATLTVQYNMGINMGHRWSARLLPSMPFSELSRHISELAARDELRSSLSLDGLGRLAALNPDRGALLWMALGLILFVSCSAARLRLSWWPLHPVIFLVWGTGPCARLYLSFLLGWIIKASVINLAGARYYEKIKPLMIGVIAGELIAALFWIAVGVAYFLATGQVERYYMFSG